MKDADQKRRMRLELANGLFWGAGILVSAWLLKDSSPTVYGGMMMFCIWMQISISARLQARRRECRIPGGSSR